MWPLPPTSIINHPHCPSTTHIGCRPPKTTPRHQPNKCRRGQGDTIKRWGEMMWQQDVWWWQPGCVLPAQVSTPPPLPCTDFPQRRGNQTDDDRCCCHSLTTRDDHSHTTTMTIRVQGATSTVMWQPINGWWRCRHSSSLFTYYCNSKYFTFVPTHPLMVPCYSNYNDWHDAMPPQCHATMRQHHHGECPAMVTKWRMATLSPFIIVIYSMSGGALRAGAHNVM